MEKQPASDTGVSAPPSDPRLWIVLGGILLVAAALRLVGISYGLPFPLLNPDEASIVPRAWEMGNGGGLDPGWYDYPTLLMELLAPLQALFAEPSYGAARAVAVAIGLAGVAATWWLGRRAYGTPAALVGAAAVAVATTHVAYSRMAVTDVLLTLGVTVSLALLLESRLELAGLVAGLAASAKYPGVLLAVPLLVAGWGEWRRLGRAAALAALAFVLTSPFVLLNAGAAQEDISRVQRLARAGWLGFEDDPATPLAFLDRTWDTIGPLLILSALGVVLALARRARSDLVLVSFAVAYTLYLLPLNAHFDRYVLPLVPVLAVLAGTLRLAVPVCLAVLVVPLAWSARDAWKLTGTDTRVVAADWIGENISPMEVIAADPSTLPLTGRPVVRFDLPGPGRAFDQRRDLAALRRLGVRWVLVSGAVSDRVVAARSRYPREAAFYESLAERLEPAFGIFPSHELDVVPLLTGPWVQVYRL